MSKRVRIGLVASGLILGLGVFVYAYRDQLFPKVTIPDQTVEATKTPQKPIDPTKHDLMDADFAKKMIIHNQQAIQIADMAKKRAVSGEVRLIATNIDTKLSAETQQYINWLTEWGESYLNLSEFPQTEGHDLYPKGPGMASLGELNALKVATGSSVDEQFLNLMVMHHEGTVKMANDAAFENMQLGKMLQLKAKTLKRQAEEVKTMKRLQPKEVQ